MSFYEGKKVLLTGAAGFLGRSFYDQLQKEGARLSIVIHKFPPRPEFITLASDRYIVRDLANRADCAYVCDGMDYVFHAAGTTASAGKDKLAVMDALVTNLTLTANMLEAAWKAGVKRFLMFSSGTTAYGDYPLTYSEDEMYDYPVADCYYGYGSMRRYLEQLAAFVHKESKTRVAICRPTAVYGPHDNFGEGSHFIPALIRRAVAKEDPFVVWGDGTESRDVLHVSDLVRGCLLLLEKHAEGDPVNIGAGQPTQIRDVVRMILEAAGHNPKVVYDDAKPGTIKTRAVKTEKAERLLGFRPEIPLKDGIKATVEWYKRETGQ